MAEDKKHSILAPSAASRWLACPPSALLAEQAGEDAGSTYAAEGTLAHRLAELYLRDFLIGREWMAAHPNKDYDLGKENPEGLAALADAVHDPLYYRGMFDEVKVYTDYVVKLYDKAGAGTRMMVEAEVPLFYKPDDCGTIDSLVCGGDRTLYVTDLKFGKGVKVDAKENKQLLIYAISALDMLMAEDTAPRIERVVMTIVQPRLHHTSVWELAVADLDTERDLIDTGARKALAGEGKLKTGDHCRFCPVKPRCRALKELAAETARKQFDDPALLSTDEIAALLGSLDTISDWIASVKKYALNQALDGTRYTGYKLVAGPSRRKITDEPALLKALTAAGYDEVLLRRWSLVTLSELEKIVTKEDFSKTCTQFIARTESAPALVAATDPRPEYGIAKAVEDFAEFDK